MKTIIKRILIGVFVLIIGNVILHKSGFFNKDKNVTNVRTGDKSPIIQAGDNASIHVEYYEGYTEIEKLEAENKKLKEEIEKYKGESSLFPNRPKVVVINPSVTITNWKDGSIVYGERVNGCVTAGFNIKFLNIGGKAAQKITTKWNISDNDKRITGLNEWLTVFLKKGPLVRDHLPVNSLFILRYGPHIGSSGEGTLKLVINYEYFDAETGKKYSEEYKGFVDYKTEKNSKDKLYLLSPF